MLNVSKIVAVCLFLVSVPFITQVNASKDDGGVKFEFIEQNEYFDNGVTQSKKVEDFKTVELQEPIEYYVMKGDTLESIGKRAGIDPRYIVESNKGIIYGKVDKSSPNFVEEGQRILIPHKTGIAYRLKEGENAESVMQKFNFGKKTFLEYNKSLDVKEGDIIVFPISNERLRDANGEARNASEFYWGQCTWYVAEKLQGYITWGGNANKWLENAGKAGAMTGSEAIPGAIIVMGGKSMPLGHVGYVEEVYDDSFKISEMNNIGLGKKNYRDMKKDHATIRGFIYVGKARDTMISRRLVEE